MLRAGGLLYYAPGEVLYSAGEPAQIMLIVLAGAFQIEYPKPGERRGFVAAMLLAPAIVGECQVLHGGTWSGTGIALTPLTVLALDRTQFDRLLREHVGFAHAAYLELSLRFFGAIEAWKHRDKALPVETVARYLLSYFEILKRCGAAEGEVPALRQGDLAGATGLRRETVNRLLHQWAKKGTVKFSRQGIEAIRAPELAGLLPEKRGDLLVRASDPLPLPAAP